MPENLPIPQMVNRASQLLDSGKLPEAEQLFRQILAIEPANAPALHGLGIVALRTKNIAPAIQLLRRSIQVAPQVPRYRVNLATALRANKQFDDALRVLQENLRYFPSDIPTFRELGAALGEINRPADSIAAYEQSLALRSRLPNGPDEAEQKRIDARVHVNIGAMLAALGRTDDALVAHDRALELFPDFPIGHMNRGHLLFRKGRLREAFADYEWRWKVSDFTAQWAKYAQPPWDGSDLGGKTVLLWHEQGMGDTIQFARYAPMVAGRNGRAILLVQPALKSLMQTLDPAVQIISDDDPLPDFDFHLPILGLPRVFGTELDTIPAAGGYLKTDPQLVQAWRDRLRSDDVRGKEPLLRVGLVWSGSTAFVDNHNRSMPLAAMSPLLMVRGVRFYSLQKGEPAKQLTGTPLPAPVTDLSPHLTDFAQTAAALRALDLFITVDTGPAHLAGAIAAPVWTMLCFEPDFRWLWDRDQSSWYQSMRLFQQPAPGDWAPVVAKVEAELRKSVESARGAKAADVNIAALPVSTTNVFNVADVLAKTNALLNGKKVAEALGLLADAVRAAPGDFYVRRQYALALKLAGRNDEAIAEYCQALLLHAAHPRHESEQTRRLAAAEVYSNLATALTDSAQHDEALAAIDKAIELDPANPRFHLNRVSMRMRHGDLPGAFEDYEHRWRDGTMTWPDFAQPAWDGSDLSGKTILLWHEQGLGDTIQFARFIPSVAQRAAKLLVRCQPPLVRLLRTLRSEEPPAEGQKRGRTHYLNMCVPFSGDENTATSPVISDEKRGRTPLNNMCVPFYFAEGEPAPAFDVHAPLMSLPRLLGTTLEQLPAPQRYLKAEPSDVVAWRERLSKESDSGLRVGIVCAGSLLHPNDRNRSLPIEALAPLMAVPGLRFYSLQKGAAGEQLVKLYRDRIVDHATELKDFADTAALIETLDLVISVDTAVAHLAGAMGKPVWTLLPAEPDFRWLFEGRESRWYPSMTLYRQPRAGDWAGAIASVERDLRQRAGHSLAGASPNDPDIEAKVRAAHQQHAMGRIQEAKAIYQEVLSKQPEHASALHHLGLLMFQEGQHEPALEMMRRAVAIDASQAFYFKNFATVCRQAGHLEESEQMLRKAIELAPGDPTSWEELGVTLEKLDRVNESIAAYRKAIQILEANPSSPALNDPNARRAFEAKLNSNLGMALERNNEYDAAMPHFERAIAGNPSYSRAHMHRATLLFRRRDLPGAFAEYEWRFRSSGFPTEWRNYPQPLWDGSDLKGRTILLWPEQGLGDVLQFSRFVPVLAARGANVILQAMPELVRVLRTLDGNVRVIGTKDVIPAFDVHLPLVSVPRVLGTTMQTLPAPQSYLKADPPLAAQWAQRFEEFRRIRTADRLSELDQHAPQCGPDGKQNLRAGVTWSGSPSFGLNHRRSIPIELLQPLLEIRGIDWFSLQMGEARTDLSKVSAPIVDLSKAIKDFADSAAIVANLDLLITTDTAIVHLAGALGIPTWVMLWSERDYRWLLDDRTMPWYPSVRPFLQTRAGQWEDVIQSIASELRPFLARSLATGSHW